MTFKTASSLLLLFAEIATVSACKVYTIDSSSNWGTWEGWGTSLAWWAKAFGNNEQLADITFSLDTVSYSGASLPGLGMTIARYNAGACSWNQVDGEVMVVAPDISPSRQIDGFWLDPASTIATSSSWNFTVDANQRNMMQLAKNRGVKTFELFSNSPMWWMCINQNPSGSNDGSSNNLQPQYYEQHALYLATIAKYASEHWGIDFVSVDAFNEPSDNDWSGLTGSQEGCHFSIDSMSDIIPRLRSELDRQGLTSVIVSASDENTYDEAITTWNGLTSTARTDVGRINVHGYQFFNGNRSGLYELASAAGKGLWNSEYSEPDPTGYLLASSLLLDLQQLHPTAWIYWQVVDDSSGWGLMLGNDTSGTLGVVNQKYYVLAQFTRHIRPGMRILSGGSSNAIAAYDAERSKLVIVAVNLDDAGNITFDLSNFSQPSVDGSLVKRWSTQIGDSGLQYQAYSDTHMKGKFFFSHFDTGVIQTFEISDVKL